MSICRLLFQWASTIKIQLSILVKYKANLITISLKINLFSPWYSWKIAELTLSNNHSLNHSHCLMGNKLCNEGKNRCNLKPASHSHNIVITSHSHNIILKWKIRVFSTYKNMFIKDLFIFNIQQRRLLSVDTITIYISLLQLPLHV